MKLKFHGTRGSFPLVKNEASVLESYQTSCVELISEESPRNLLFFDAGSGLNNALAAYFKNTRESVEQIHICLSHTHWDHVMGLASLYPWFSGERKVYIYSGFADIRERIDNFFTQKFWPIPENLYKKHITTVVLDEKEKHSILGYDVSLKKHRHPGDCFSYSLHSRSSSVLYCTDIEFQEEDQALYEDDYYKKHQYLIFDTHLSVLNEGAAKYGHSSLEDARTFAKIIQCPHVFCTHHDPVKEESLILENYHTMKELLKADGVCLYLAQDNFEWAL